MPCPEAGWCAAWLCRILGVQPLPSVKTEGSVNHSAYTADFKERPAFVKLLFGNHEAALVHAAWADAGLAPPLLESKPVTYRGYATGIHMVRFAPSLSVRHRSRCVALTSVEAAVELGRGCPVSMHTPR